jgi:hypothetical protein
LFDQRAGVVGAVQLAHQFEHFAARRQRAVTFVEVFPDIPCVMSCAECPQVFDL